MENKELLNEERYQKTNKKVGKAAIIVLIIGFIIGGTLLFFGFRNVLNNNKEFSEEGRSKKIEKINAKLSVEQKVLEEKKKELINKGVRESFDYNNTDGYDLYMLNSVLDPSDATCNLDEETYPLTSSYCALKNELDDVKRMNLDFEKSWNNAHNAVFFMFGGFILFTTLAIAGHIFRISKNREILAYGTQQAMPVVKEGAEKMAPTIGVIAKEVVKGINEAKEEYDKCKECGHDVKKGAKFCENCGKKM